MYHLIHQKPTGFFKNCVSSSRDMPKWKELPGPQTSMGRNQGKRFSAANTGHFNEKGSMSQRLPRGWPGERWRTIPRSRASSTCPVDSGIAVDHWLLCTFWSLAPFECKCLPLAYRCMLSVCMGGEGEEGDRITSLSDSQSTPSVSATQEPHPRSCAWRKISEKPHLNLNMI